MEDIIIRVCTFCKIVPEAQSNIFCYKCKRKLSECNMSKEPLERQEDFDFILKKKSSMKE